MDKNDGGSSSSATKQAENIVLVGRTGNGKSATANSLVGKKVFESKAHATGVTMKCQTHEAVTADGHTINVIDTPGLFDLSVSAEFISREIVRCLTLAEGGIHAVILVLSARTRITQEEENTLSSLQALFGSQILPYVIVVFTGGDVLEEDGETLQEFLDKGCPAFIKEVMRRSGNRMVLMDNKTRDEEKKAKQVRKLLSLVDEVRRSNKGRPYTDDMYIQIKKHTEKLRKQYEVLESKNHSADLNTELKEKFQASFEKNMALMSNTLEKKLADALEKQKKALAFGQMNPRVQMGNDDQPMVTMSVPMPRLPCNFL